MIKANKDAEQSIIGAILIKADEIMPEAERILDYEDFITPEYRNIFRACSDLFVDGKPIDAVTVVDRLGVEYRALVATAIDVVPSTKNWRDYARIVKDTAKRNNAYSHSVELLDALTRGEPITDCQGVAVRACEALSHTENDNTVSAKQGYIQFYAFLQRDPEYITTGFSGIDRRAQIGVGDFVIIGARPSVGKTAITLQMMMHIAKTRRVAYFSLETRANNLFGRMIANAGGISLRDIKTRTGLDFVKVAKTHSIFEELKFHCVEASGWTVAQIKAKAIQLGAEVVFVDYLGLVRDNGKTAYDRATNVSKDLQVMAKAGRMTVFAACQLSRDGKGVPNITHLRESGQIEQDADVILMLHAPEGIESQQRDVILGKNKEGEVGAVKMFFNGAEQRFSELDSFRS